MKTTRLIFYFLFVVVATSSVQAQEVRKKIKASVTRQRYTQLHLGYQMWQESFDASSGGVPSEMLAHLHGFRLGYSWHKPLKNVRWVSVYGADFGFGMAKGTAATPLTDEVKSQPWYMATVYPGLIYRTTSRSELGVLLPLSYRRVQWDVKAPFELDKENSFSVGLTGLYINRFNLRNSFVVSISHQQMWSATVFGIGYQYDFRR